MYRPLLNDNERYQSFNNEIVQVLRTGGNFNCDNILTGDLTIHLLNVNVKHIFNEFLDIITSHSFYPHKTLPTSPVNTKYVYTIYTTSAQRPRR